MDDKLYIAIIVVGLFYNNIISKTLQHTTALYVTVMLRTRRNELPSHATAPPCGHRWQLAYPVRRGLLTTQSTLGARLLSTFAFVTMLVTLKFANYITSAVSHLQKTLLHTLQQLSLNFCYKDNLLKPEFQQKIYDEMHTVRQPFFDRFTEFANQQVRFSSL